MAESLRILMLEDNPADVDLIQFELQEAGLTFTAKVVMTEEDFVQEIQDYWPDLILSDYDLPKYNGALALAEAKRRCPDTPFILVTGAVTEDRAIEILTQGAKDYVLKHRLQQRLAPAVRRALAEAEEQRARKKAEEELREAHRSLESQVAERTADLQKEIEHRYRVEQSLLKYNEQIELLSYTASRLLASGKPQQLVEELCLKVMEFLDCDAFFNFLVDEAAGRLHLNACAGIPKETMREIEWLDYGVAVCGCAARDACRIVAENIPITPDVRTELVKSFGIKAYACHPLMEQNRVLGTLSFGTRSRMTFSSDDLALMKAVADQVAIAISRVRTEDALRESEEHHRLLAETMLQGVVHQSASGEIIAMNQAAERILGKSREQFLGSSSVQEEDDTIRENGERFPGMEHPAMVALRTGLPVRGVIMGVFNPQLGDYRWIKIDALPLFRPGETRPSEVYTVFDDITERKRAEEDLHRSEERYRALFDGMTEGFAIHEIITDEQDTPVDWRFLDINPAFERLTGLRREDVVGKTHNEVLPGDDPKWLRMYGAVALTGEPVQFENYSPALNRHYEVLAYRPAPRQFAVIFMDITEHRQAEEAVNRSQKTFYELVERSPFGTYVVDSQFRIVQMNAASQTGAFRNVRPAIGRDFNEAMRILWPEPVAAEIIAVFRHTLDTSEPYYSPRFMNPRHDVTTVESYE